MEQWTDRKTVFEGKILDVHAGQVRLDDGLESYREMVGHGGGVGVLPYDGDRVYLVRQYRICIEDYLIEIPAGRLEPGEDPTEAALRELEEEIGYRANTLIPVGSFYASPGFTNTLDRIFLGLDLVPTQQNLEHDERIEIVTMPLDEAETRLRKREFTDGKTAMSLYALLDYLRRSEIG